MADGKPAVVEVALSATEAVIAALYRGIGVDTDAFPEVCFILETAMRSPHHEELSATAARLVPAMALRLSLSADKVKSTLHNCSISSRALKAMLSSLVSCSAIRTSYRLSLHGLQGYTSNRENNESHLRR